MWVSVCAHVLTDVCFDCFVLRFVMGYVLQSGEILKQHIKENIIINFTLTDAFRRARGTRVWLLLIPPTAWAATHCLVPGVCCESLKVLYTFPVIIIIAIFRGSVCLHLWCITLSWKVLQFIFSSSVVMVKVTVGVPVIKVWLSSVFTILNFWTADPDLLHSKCA